MKRLLFLSASALLLASCNLRDSDADAQAIALREQTARHNDSVRVLVDSLNHIDIAVQPLYDESLFDAETVGPFVDLARQSGGEAKVLVHSKLVTAEILRIVQAHAAADADLLLLIDKTSSMEDDIANVRRGLGRVLDALQAYPGLRLGIGLYGDKNEDDADWFSFRNFGTDLNDARRYLNGVEVTGGGDWPESVYDAFFRADASGFWRSGSKRMVILIGDAPPLAKPLSDYDVADVIRAAQGRIKMNFYPIIVSATGEEDLPKTAKEFTPARLVTGLYPNPATTAIHLRLEAAGTYEFEIFNTGGQLLQRGNFAGSQWDKDVTGLANGAYLLRVRDAANHYETQRFVVYR